MARIAFFTESLPPAGDVIGRFAWDLIQSLADQQHEIRVFSTYRDGQELPNKHPRIEILRPFKNWGLLEIPKIVPQLLQFQPEVIHIIQPHQEALSGLSNAMELLPGLKAMIGRPICIASFFDLSEKSLRRHRLLLGQLEALTVSNELQRGLLDNIYAEARKPLIEVVPLGFASTVESGEIVIEEDVDTSLAQIDLLKKKFPELIAIAGPIESHVDPLASFESIAAILKKNPNSSVIVIGGWGFIPIRLRHTCEEILFEAEVENRVLLTGGLTESQEARYLKEATCVLAAPVSESRLAFMRFLRNAQKEAIPIILSREQAQLDPILWVDADNALVRNRIPSDLSDAVYALLNDSSLRARLRTNLAEFSRKAVADQPGNLVSRLYVRALSS